MTGLRERLARHPARLFFAGTLLTYGALAPGSLDGRGYNMEEIEASRRLLDLAAGRGAGAPMVWPRHGFVEPLVKLPFVFLARLLAGDSLRAESAAASLLPILASALIAAIVFAWVERASGSLRRAFVVASAVAFGTMLWPYAYVGLETTQSLALVLAAWLALGGLEWRGPAATATFVTASAVAVSAKGGGAFLLPAVAFLAWIWFRDRSNGNLAAARLRFVAAMAAVGALLLASSATRAAWYAPFGGQLGFYSAWLVDDPLSALFNAAIYLASPNKGLLFFAPIALLGIAALRPRSYEHRRVALFAGLCLVGLVAGCAPLRSFADETWGPRYLHSAIAPLAVCLGASKRGRDFRFSRELPLALALLLGFGVSLLGSLFYYGRLYRAAAESGPPSLEQFQSDPAWNHVLFDARLARLWLSPTPGAGSWTPTHLHWTGSQIVPQRGAPVELSRWASPQALLLRSRSSFETPPPAGVRGALALALLAGLAALVVAGVASFRSPGDQRM